MRKTHWPPFATVSPPSTPISSTSTATRSDGCRWPRGAPGRGRAQEWGERLIRAWNEGWLDLPQRTRRRNWHRSSAPRRTKSSSPIPRRSTCSSWPWPRWGASAAGRTIITDDLNFPSDRYILERRPFVRPARPVQVIPSPDGIHAPIEQITRRHRRGHRAGLALSCGLQKRLPGMT